MVDWGSAPPITAASALPSGSQTAAISGMLGMIWPFSAPASATFATAGSAPSIWSSVSVLAGTFLVALKSWAPMSARDQ